MLTFRKPGDLSLETLHTELKGMYDLLNRQTNALEEFVKQNAVLLDSYLIEGGLNPQVGTTGTPWKIDAQTGDVEVVTSIISWFPATAQSIFLQMDDIKMPLPVGLSVLSTLQIPVRTKVRTVTWANAQATDQPFVLLCARPAPAAVPGVLH